MRKLLTRREALAAALAGSSLQAGSVADSHQATGVKVGEVTPTSALIWTRRTQSPRRLDNGVRYWATGKEASHLAQGADVNAIEGACPGEAGYVKVTVEAQSGPDRRLSKPWAAVNADTDFTHQFRIDGLRPATVYRYAVETKRTRGGRAEAALVGRFGTAPPESAHAAVQFVLMTCQMYCHMDREDGFWIYDSIQKLQPDVYVSCGDNVYYDSESPIANSIAVARYHWHRMFSLSTISSCLLNTPGYWQKDDHDVYSDDCWSTLRTPKMEAFRFEDGQRIFREQAPVPAGELYRRFRWGSAVEVWLPESRDYRSPNNAPDGPSKSLWGAEQKKWLKDSLLSSDAEWKILFNPDPVIGPDHKNKADNHADPAFATEGREIRQFLRENLAGRVILTNGDRHWQYHSVDPESGLHEFGCGPASDVHAVSPSEGRDPRYHKFLRIKGGFLVLRVDPTDAQNHLTVEHRDVMGSVVYRRVYRKPDPKNPWA